MKHNIWIGAALMVAAMAVSADVKETEEMTFDVNPGARISLENINGDITVVGGSDEVVVIAHKKADNQEYLDKLKITVDATADYVRIETRHPKREGGWFSWGNDGGGSVAYELSVPDDVELDAIEVSGLASDVSLETVNGSIDATFDTLGEGQRVEADAVNGKITLHLPSTCSARVTAETVNGSIDADDFGLEPEKGFVGRDLSGEIGGGDARISLNTVNGSIRLKKN
jgi:DUF4097 and DUF4098 domain-containing protein YvlB